MPSFNRYCNDAFYAHFLHFFTDILKLAKNSTRESNQLKHEDSWFGYTPKKDKKVTKAEQVLKTAMVQFIRVLNELSKPEYDRNSIIALCKSCGLADGLEGIGDLEGIDDPLVFEITIIGRMLSKFEKELLDPDNNPWLDSQHDEVKLFIVEHAGKGYADSIYLLKDLLTKERQKASDAEGQLQIVAEREEEPEARVDTAEGIVGERRPDEDLAMAKANREKVRSKMGEPPHAHEGESELDAAFKRPKNFSEPAHGARPHESRPFSEQRTVAGMTADYEQLISNIIDTRSKPGGTTSGPKPESKC
jgi:hypothetical protein